jgi:hypothetical protein
VLPAAGVTVSQLTPLVLVAIAVKFRGDEPTPVTAMLCGAGTAPPTTWVNASEAGAAASVPTDTCSVTGMVTGLLATGCPAGLVAVTVMLPV